VCAPPPTTAHRGVAGFAEFTSGLGQHHAALSLRDTTDEIERLVGDIRERWQRVASVEWPHFVFD